MTTERYEDGAESGHENNTWIIDVPPKRSEWRMYFFCDPSADSNHKNWYSPIEGKEPNWFHRKMQELCFGVKWRKE